MDVNHLADRPGVLDIFVEIGARQTVTTGGYNTWRKPHGCQMVYIWGCGPGGNGGAGASRAANANGGGGGGGGTPQIMEVLVPAILLPDSLYTFVPAGGSTTATQVRGFPPSAGATGLVDLSCNPGGSGGIGSGTAGGGGGSPAIITSTISGLATKGILGTIGGGTTGAAGGFTANGNSLTVFQGTSNAGAVNMGGAGGAGVSNSDFIGGSVVSPDPLVFPTVLGGQNPGDRGLSGIPLFPGSSGSVPLLPFGTSGTGGASNNNGVGGAGGNAYGVGCGGGGGGAGVTGGAGGRGGPGAILIIAW